MHINQFFSYLICSVILSTAAQLSQSAYFALQCPYTVFGLGRTPNFVDDLAAGMPGSIKRVRIGKYLHRVFADRFVKTYPNLHVPVVQSQKFSRYHRCLPLSCPY